LPLQQRQRQSLEHQHAGERHDKGGNAEIGDPIALRRADHRTHHEAGQDRGREIEMILHHQHRGHGADEACDRADRQVDMAGDDDEQHAERHDHDVAVLQHQIGQIERLQQRAVGHELEEQHDDEQRHQHAVAAQIVLDEAAVRLLLRERNRLVGHDQTPPTRIKRSSC
jgi:hypothetical protein